METKKQKEASRKWYLENKGKTIEHKKINCIICDKQIVQRDKTQVTCGGKDCIREHMKMNGKVYYARDREKNLEYKKKFYDKNTSTMKDRSKDYYEKNKEQSNKNNLEYVKARYKVDEAFRMRRYLGTALGLVIRDYIKTGKISNPMKKYGIDWEGIIKVVTPIPKPRKDYHVDHIVPLYKFDLSDFEQIHLAFTPENHRWLKAKDNMKRSKLKRRKHEI